MKAMFRHELSSYFTNITGYVFGAFLLLFVGIFTMIYNINYSVSNYEYVLGNMSFVFLIIVPVLTMRSIAEERKQKTDQLLYSLPLTMTQVVLGKYGAIMRAGFADDTHMYISAGPVGLRQCVSAGSFRQCSRVFLSGGCPHRHRDFRIVPDREPAHSSRHMLCGDAGQLLSV